MKRILGIALALFFIGASPALAVCPATLQLKDNAGVTPNAKYSDDGSGNCMPNVVVNGSTLPAGAATAAKQPALGTAGSPSTDVISVQGVASGTPQPVSVASSTPEGGLTDAPATLPASSTSASIIALLKALANVGQYPSGATAITASTTGTTAATTATLAGTTGKTTYICSLSIRANATAAATGNATVTGTITGTLNYTQWTAPNASGVGITEQIFNPCIPASATNTGIAVISAAPGSGGVVSVAAAGYQL
jgi:hypothetical protein